AEVTDLALLLQQAERPHRLGERRLVVLLMQVKDVDVVGAEPAPAFLAALPPPLARQPAMVRPGPANVSELGREHPVVALIADRPPRHLFGFAAGVAVGRVD